MVLNADIVERLAELVVIVSLMGAGLKLDRPFEWSGWSSTWRLLGITMPLTIAAVVLLAWGVLGLHIATAVLLGAAIAPTDPVLASSVGATEPLEEVGAADEVEEAVETDVEQEEPVRFALTSEAGLNDGLAFPFTNLAIALAAASSVTSFAWAGDWLLFDVVYKIVVGVVMGYLSGQVFARVIFRIPVTSRVAEAMEGAEAFAATLIAYGVTELVFGYGFIAVFVAALVLRYYEWEHEYYLTLHDYAVMIERLLMAAMLVLFGGAIAGGLLAPLTLLEVGVGLAVLFVVRPVAGVIGLIGIDLEWPRRFVIAGFGIRGIGSFYYLSFAMNESSFQELELLVAAEQLWALVGFVVLTSIVVHGVAASPVMSFVDRWLPQRDLDARRTPREEPR